MDRSLVGAMLGRYEVNALIGEGGMAQVYRATDPTVGRAVAIKVIHPRLARDQEFVARFLREAQVVARLQHPHIVPLYDFGEQDGLPYIVMPYLPGGTLAERLRPGLTPNDALLLLGPIAAALDYAHARGVIHRDVKPANILFTAEGEPLLTDFGIARATGDATLTAAGTQLGTALYLSPEQAQGQPLDGRSDLYSLASIFYVALAGRPPFPMTETDTALSVALRIITTPPPPPSAINPALSPAVDAALLRGLAKAPAERFPAGGALCAALSAALAEPPALTPSLPHPPQVATVQIPAPRNVPAPGRDERGNRRLLAVAGILAVVLVIGAVAGVGAWWLLGASGGAAATPTAPVVVAMTPPPAANTPTVPQIAAVSATATAVPLTATPRPASAMPTPALPTPTVAPVPTSTPLPPATATQLPPPTPTVPPPTAVPPPPPRPTVAPTAAPTAAASALETTAYQAILSLPGTSSGVFALLDAPFDYAADDPEMVLPAGSLIKLPIAGAAYEQVAQGRWQASDTFTLTAANRTEGTGIIKDQPLGTTYTLEQVVEIMLLHSDNTAANMLIDRFGGFAPINDFSVRLGLTQTTLRRKLFDQAAQARGLENTTTTGDMARFLLRLGAGNVVSQAVSERLLDHLIARARRDPEWLLRDLPTGAQGAHLSGTLTGYRADAGIIEANGKLYILVLFARDPDEAGIERAVARISAEIYRAVSAR